jgi:hypothetical protein
MVHFDGFAFSECRGKPRVAFKVGGGESLGVAVDLATHDSDCGRIGEPSVVQELQIIEIPLPDVKHHPQLAVTSGFGQDIASNALVEGTRFRTGPVDHDRAACVVARKSGQGQLTPVDLGLIEVGLQHPHEDRSCVVEFSHDGIMSGQRALRRAERVVLFDGCAYWARASSACSTLQFVSRRAVPGRYARRVPTRAGATGAGYGDAMHSLPIRLMR